MSIDEAIRRIARKHTWTWVEVSLAGLKTMEVPKSYAGGSTKTHEDAFKDYVAGKRSDEFGSCDPDDFDHCYFAKVPKDVIAAENELLRLRFVAGTDGAPDPQSPLACNKDTISNISKKDNGKGGYVYVCRMGAEPSRSRPNIKTQR